jgi:hypothetical protein
MPVPITDYRLPKHFLAGFAQYKLPWCHSVRIDPELSEAGWKTIEHFRWRAGEFLSNVDDLGLPGLYEGSMHVHFERNGRRQRGRFRSSIWPGRHRAKSIILDLRPLLLQKGTDSLSNLNRAANTIIRHTKDELLMRFVNAARERFLSGDVKLTLEPDVAAELNTTSIQGLIELWFNAHYFHNGNDSQLKEASRISRIFDANGIEQLVLHSAVTSAHDVRSLYAVLQRTAQSHPLFSRPHERIILRR